MRIRWRNRARSRLDVSSDLSPTPHTTKRHTTLVLLLRTISRSLLRGPHASSTPHPPPVDHGLVATLPVEILARIVQLSLEGAAVRERQQQGHRLATTCRIFYHLVGQVGEPVLVADAPRAARLAKTIQRGRKVPKAIVLDSDGREPRQGPKFSALLRRCGAALTDVELKELDGRLGGCDLRELDGGADERLHVLHAALKSLSLVSFKVGGPNIIRRGTMSVDMLEE